MKLLYVKIIIILGRNGHAPKRLWAEMTRNREVGLMITHPSATDKTIMSTPVCLLSPFKKWLPSVKLREDVSKIVYFLKK